MLFSPLPPVRHLPHFETPPPPPPTLLIRNALIKTIFILDTQRRRIRSSEQGLSSAMLCQVPAGRWLMVNKCDGGNFRTRRSLTPPQWRQSGDISLLRVGRGSRTELFKPSTSLIDSARNGRLSEIYFLSNIFGQCTARLVLCTIETVACFYLVVAFRATFLAFSFFESTNRKFTQVKSTMSLKPT